MNEAFRLIGPVSDLLIVADHASAHVPSDINLGIDPALMTQHMALDIGVAEVAALLADRLPCQAMLGGVSRLVIDYNREEEAPGLIPLASDGHVIAGNADADREDRIERFYRPYHAALSGRIDQGVAFILSLHSFTPALGSDPTDLRPWDVGILYNDDDRGARIAIPLLEGAGLNVGDQLPYSGKLLNATMNHHAEARGIPYLGVEIRQDHVGDAAGQRRFADLLAPVVLACRNALAPSRPF